MLRYSASATKCGFRVRSPKRAQCASKNSSRPSCALSSRKLSSQAAFVCPVKLANGTYSERSQALNPSRVC